MRAPPGSVRVLFVVPWDQEVGGVASVVGNLARGLEKRGHRAVFLHPGTADELVLGSTKWGFRGYRLRLRGPFVADRPIRSVVAFWLLLAPSLARLAGLIRRERIDVVNIHYPLESFLPVVLASRLTGRPVVTSVHGADLFPGGSAPTRYALGLRLALRLSQRIVAPSRSFLDQVLGRFGALRERAGFIHNGIRLEELLDEGSREPARGSAVDQPEPALGCCRGPATPNGRYALTIAAHNQKKALDVLLEAFGRIAARFPDLTLVLVGDGPLRSELEDLASRLGLGERVRFLGARGRRETIALLRGCDLFVLPSRAEPFGLAVLEAMACGKPVVASRVGGLQELVRDGTDGKLLEPDDPAGLADAMAGLLDDRDAAHRLGRTARARARDFSTEANVRAYETLFARLKRS